MFVCLPMGFGKSLCYYCLPMIYDKLYKRDDSSSMIIVASLLVALMSDQVSLLMDKGVSSISFGDLDDKLDDSSGIKTNIVNG